MPSYLTDEEKTIRKDSIESFLAQGLDRPKAIAAAAELLGMRESALSIWAERETEKDSPFAPDWTEPAEVEDHSALLSSVKVVEYPKCRKFIFTAAQDETPVHTQFLDNLVTYANSISAELIIGGFTYQKGLFDDHKVTTAVFAPSLHPHLNPNVVPVGQRLTWFGRANIIPTKTNPLGGWETNTRGKWMIVPHARIHLKSIPRAPSDRSKQIMSSGVVTLPNYTCREAGVKSEFHHTIGATIVELGMFDQPFCRQIHAEPDGSFYDLTKRVENGKITDGHSVEAITWGDLHRYVLNREVSLGSWGFDTDIDQTVNSTNMLDVLKPKFQFYHDSFDMYSRGHHTRNNSYERQRRLLEPIDEVEYEIKQCADFLSITKRPWCKSVHVNSNHNRHLERWVLDTTVLSNDPLNEIYWLELRALYMRAGRSNTDDFILHAAALQMTQKDMLDGIQFLPEGSFKVLDIECGFHGDKGPNGARGSIANLSRITDRINIADKHQPAIREGLYCAGTSSDIELDYNRGAHTSWDHTHTVTYKNGMRTLITFQDGYWRG